MNTDREDAIIVFFHNIASIKQISSFVIATCANFAQVELRGTETAWPDVSFRQFVPKMHKLKNSLLQQQNGPNGAKSE